MKRAIILVFAIMAIITVKAQTFSLPARTDNYQAKDFSSPKLDGGITLGTTGIGLELTGHLSKSWDVRGGFDFYPHFKYDMHFNVTVEGDANSTGDISESKFQKMSQTLKDLTGYNVDDQVTMEGRPTMYNFKLLVDFKPFTNKHWHVTAGFYWGNSKIADAENAKGDMTSLFAVGLYNHMYDVAFNDEPYATINGEPLRLPEEVAQKLIENGRMGVHVGTYKHDMPYKHDVYYKDDELGEDGQFHSSTEIKYRAGVDIEHHKGDEYNMEPDENSMVKAKVKVNKFKPYVGFGYMGALSKKEPRWQVGFDAGVAFWGGTPEITTHDGTDLINDVTDLRHGVKKYVNLMKAAKVLPVLNFRITRTIF